MQQERTHGTRKDNIEGRQLSLIGKMRFGEQTPRKVPICSPVMMKDTPWHVVTFQFLSTVLPKQTVWLVNACQAFNCHLPFMFSMKLRLS